MNYSRGNVDFPFICRGVKRGVTTEEARLPRKLTL